MNELNEMNFFSREVFDGMYTRKTNWDDNNMPVYYPVIGASGNALTYVYVYIYTLVTVIVTVLMQL